MLTRRGLGLSAVALALTTTALPAWADFWSDAGAQFQGVTLHGVTESTPPSNYIKDVLAPAFEEATGIQVEIETTSWDQMYDKAIKDMEAGTGIYDMVYIEQDIIYAYLARNFLVDITKTLADHPELKSPDFDEANFTTFADYFRGEGNDLFGVPMEAFIKVYLYRTDLFNDPEIQAAFKEQTGRDLAPATNHEEYTQIAEFFTKWGQDHDMELWGTTAQAHTGHPASWYEFFESIAPTYGVYNWGINADNNYAASVENGGSMNSPEAKAALHYWLHLRDIAPPESAASTWTEVGTTFAAGRVAQGLVYGENAAWIASDPNQSKVVGNVGVALPPVEPGVMEAAESGNGYIGYYDGGAFGVPVTSKNQEAALLFLEYIGQNSVQADWAVAAPRITNTATYDDAKVQEMDASLGGYYTMLRDDGKLFAGAPPYPFHAQVREATAPIFYQILTGEIDPDTGLDQMAAKAEEELTNLGYRQ
ncbi:N-Acetyl-D-glucosamine ABC transport system, sugar-binding protein [Rubellimicrobium mesophilum DSM 19309]|uniref:N-Acetyl-D-glucosamine ABC transport system, sugar-binding protein n=1 Tax=Rubellimicrobium mesophilum DSM 19309 TaxID=442562 RepID=A0A017HNF1_9RHOB|nr:extracellular solute-binding protein [Rubellimicrobium mesophilum]EYD75997.1 N-Acetyl-D-glucosamine ABC transport system, sugar-binding protein [Rubellimicrobium mesophilum DSM 19309]